MTLHSTDCAYLAGLIDADGSISVQKFGGQRVPTVQVHLTNRARSVLEDLREMWGGRIYERQRQENWQPCSDLRWLGAKAVGDLLRHVGPYLRIKAPQAEVAMLFVETVNGRANRTRRLSPEVLAVREEVGLVMAKLNKRGTS